MKGTSLGYDPDLGQKFSEEYSGLVIGLGKSSPKKSEEQVIDEYSREHGRAPDAQQLHDAMMSSSAPEPTETEEDNPRIGALRLARMQHQNQEFSRLKKEANPAD